MLTEMESKRLNNLANGFNNIENRKALMREFGHSETAFCGMNVDGEAILISIKPDSIVVKTNQSNGWVRVNYYDELGNQEGEAYEGRHRDY